MKALKIIGLAVLVIIISAGIAAGGYFLAVWHADQKTQTSSNSSSTNNTPDVRPWHELTPAKPTVATTCNADELTLSTEASSDSGAGTLAINIVLKNTGSRDCIQGGFPGVSLVNDNGNQIGKPADRAVNYSEKTFTLKPGETVYATVSYEEEGNFDAGTCADGATKLRVFAPNDTGYISIAQTAITSWCPGFSTSPVLQ